MALAPNALCFGDGLPGAGVPCGVELCVEGLRVGPMGPSSLEDLVTDGYVRKIPDDPMTGAADTWQTVPAESDPANPTAEPGIFDVKSGSDKSGLDGKPYSDW